MASGNFTIASTASTWPVILTKTSSATITVTSTMRSEAARAPRRRHRSARRFRSRSPAPRRRFLRERMAATRRPAVAEGSSDEPTPFSADLVDWSKTRCGAKAATTRACSSTSKAASRKGSSAIRVRVVPRRIDRTLRGAARRSGPADGSPVFRPEQIYRTVNNVPPDLIVHFGRLYWRSIGGVGYSELHVQENDTGPDDCNHAQFGVFILAAPGLPGSGQVRSAAARYRPNTADLAGKKAPPSMQGRSRLHG